MSSSWAAAEAVRNTWRALEHAPPSFCADRAVVLEVPELCPSLDARSEKDGVSVHRVTEVILVQSTLGRS